MAPVANSASVILHAISQEAEIDFRVMLKRIYDETERYLGRLGRAAHEGRAVDEANNFLRWLQFSGVLSLLEKYSFIDEKFTTLRSVATEVQRECQPHLRGVNVKPSPNLARVDELNEKVDALLAMMGKPAKPVIVTDVLPLQITAGGVK